MVFDKMLWGGIERVGVTYANILNKNGWEVDIYILDPETESIEDEITSNLKIIKINYKLSWCAENAWSLILSHDCYGLEIVAFCIKYFVCKLMKPILYIRYGIHNKKYDVAIAFSGHIKDLTYVAEGYLKARHKVAWIHGAQYQYNMISPGFFRIYKKIRNLVCLSELCDAECKNYNLKNGINKVKIYNPCNIEAKIVDNNLVYELRRKYHDFSLMVGRLAKDKDQEFIIRCFKLLNDKYGIRKTLVLVGEGEKEEYLKILVKNLHMEKIVIFLGTRTDVQNFYAAATIYVHAAPLEGFPTVFMEAMFYGLPIITTDALPGARELLGNDEYGLITPVGNIELFVDKLKQLYESPILQKKYCEAGKKRVKRFAPEIISNEILQYFIKFY